MFKHFTNCIEQTNTGYAWDWNEKGLVGKFVGLVLGEEEYIGNDGGIKTRLYVKDIKTVEQIKSGDFKIPEIKKVKTEMSIDDTGFIPMPNNDDLPF
jgi:hypothetical protein